MKHELQKKLLPDLLKDPENPIGIFSSYALCVQDSPDDIRQVYMDLKPIQKDLGPESAKGFAKAVAEDRNLGVFLRVYRNYLISPSKNYVFSKNLTKALMRTSLDILPKHLPSKFDAYIEMPGLKDEDGETLNGAFVSIFDTPKEGKIIQIACCTNIKLFDIGSFFHNIKEGQSLKDSMRNTSYFVNNPRSGVAGGYTDFEDLPENMKKFEHYMCILMGVMYITSVDSDLKDRVNEFSVKKSKQVTQKKIATERPFVVVGEDFDYEFVKKGLPGNIEVRPFWRWQPCGPKNSLHKWTRVKAHTRNKKA